MKFHWFNNPMGYNENIIFVGKIKEEVFDTICIVNFS